MLGIPVVVVPELLRVGLDGVLHAGATVGFSQHGELEAGFEYDRGTIHPVGSGEVSFDPIDPTAVQNIEVEAFIGPRMSLVLYSPFQSSDTRVGDIYGEVNAYARLEVSLGDEPWWRLFGGVEVGVAPSLSGVGVRAPQRVLPETEIANSGEDPDDDRCDDPDIFWLDRQRPVLWGGLEFRNDQDWATIAAPATTRMLLALNVVGEAEARRKNYGLELWDRECGGRLAISNRTRPAGEGCDADCQAGVGAWNDERVVVDVAAVRRYRSRVFGLTASDHVANDPDADYQLAVSFGPMNESFRLLPTEVGGRMVNKVVEYDPTPTGEAPGGVISVTMEFQNATDAEFGNLTFFLRELSATHRLLSARVATRTGRRIELDVDDPALRGPGAIVSIPNVAFATATSRLLCRLQRKATSTPAASRRPVQDHVRLGVAVKEPLRAFAVDLFATPAAAAPVEREGLSRRRGAPGLRGAAVSGVAVSGARPATRRGRGRTGDGSGRPMGWRARRAAARAHTGARAARGRISRSRHRSS